MEERAQHRAGQRQMLQFYKALARYQATKDEARALGHDGYALTVSARRPEKLEDVQAAACSEARARLKREGVPTSGSSLGAPGTEAVTRLADTADGLGSGKPADIVVGQRHGLGKAGDQPLALVAGDELPRQAVPPRGKPGQLRGELW